MPDAAKFKKLALILKGNEEVRSVIDWQREANENFSWFKP